MENEFLLIKYVLISFCSNSSSQSSPISSPTQNQALFPFVFRNQTQANNKNKINHMFLKFKKHIGPRERRRATRVDFSVGSRVSVFHSSLLAGQQLNFSMLNLDMQMLSSAIGPFHHYMESNW